MKNMIPINFAAPTAAEIALVLSILMPSVLYLLARYFDKKKNEKELALLEAARVAAEESVKKTIADTESSKAGARKIEAEVAQNYIASAGDLVAEYKDMLKDLNAKYTAIEIRQAATEQKLEIEVEKRKQTERLLRELYHGINQLLAQFEETKTNPRWKPDDKLRKALDKLEELK